MFGVSGQDKEFFLDHYLPTLEVQTHNVSLTVLEKAEVLENTAGTLIKIFFAFFWQESIIDLGGEFGVDLNSNIEDLGDYIIRT